MIFMQDHKYLFIMIIHVNMYHVPCHFIQHVVEYNRDCISASTGKETRTETKYKEIRNPQLFKQIIFLYMSFILPCTTDEYIVLIKQKIEVDLESGCDKVEKSGKETQKHAFWVKKRKLYVLKKVRGGGGYPKHMSVAILGLKVFSRKAIQR